MSINIEQHLRNQNYPAAVQLKRVGWGLLGGLFRFSPTPCHDFRNVLLRLFGASIGRGVRLHPSVQVMFPWNLTIRDHVVIGSGANLYALAPISIQENVLISQGAHLCAGSHDYRQPHFPISHRPITIGAGTWIAAEAFVGNGVTIGRGSVVSARAVVLRDVEAYCLVVGNPAQTVKKLAQPA
jgi:putative colanic acid biosynthesis acetyltransferase WcaF